MNKKKLLSLGGALLLGTYFLFAQKQPVDYVNPLMGTDSKISLSMGIHILLSHCRGDEFLDAADWQNG